MQKIAVRVGLVDAPTTRKNHQGRVPMVGAALFVAIAVSAFLLEQRPGGFASFIIGLTALVLLGLLDDRMNLRASVKLVAQIACVALMVLPSHTSTRDYRSIRRSFSPSRAPCAVVSARSAGCSACRMLSCS
jgi:UDP-GlcNAc:undecaprenyl-phosphate GlcNAc-1-phosphate transferase